MVKRSSSKRAYKKRRTVRKSRVIRRRKTTQSKTLRGGMKSLKELGEDAQRIAESLKGNIRDVRTRFGSSGRNESASPVLMPGTLAADDVGLSEQQSSPAPPQQTDEERKAALKNERKIARDAWTDAQNKSSIAAKAAKVAAIQREPYISTSSPAN